MHHTAGYLARRALDDAIPPALHGGVHDPRLAVTELVSNAVRHARLEPHEGVIILRIQADDDYVRVEVEQPSSADEVQVIERPGTDERPGGFGLQLVEASADHWGFEPGPPGRVWFEFRT